LNDAGPGNVYRLLDLFSTASAAENFRSRCGSLRRAPVCSSHGWPIAAPHVGQGTEDICFGVSWLLFTTPIMQPSTGGKMLNNAHFSPDWLRARFIESDNSLHKF